MLHVENIAFQYPKSDYGLEIARFGSRAGRATAIVGPSGCGKTTFLNLAAGVLRPARGSIKIEKTEVSALGESAAAAFRLAQVGLIFQEFELVNHLTVRDNILLPLHLGLPLSPEDRAALTERARGLADRTGIGRYWRERPHHLSQGERQRVAICRALAIDPRLILADEPTGNLDPTNKHKVLDLMVDFARRDGRALVVATHDVELLDCFDEVVQFDELNQFEGGVMSFKGIAFLSWAYLAYRPLKTVVLVAAVALTIFLPFALQVFIGESTRILQERARSTPLVVGPKGSSIDLTLNTLYFTPQALPPLDYLVVEQLKESVDGTAIPLHVRFRAGEAPIVGTSLAYFRHRGLETDAGRLMTRLGDCVLGAAVARERGLKPGDTIISTPENVFDLAGVYPLRMRITGVLEPAHTPDDEAVFVDLKTAWIIEGLAHGHDDLSRPDAADRVLERDGKVIRGNASVREFNEVTEANLGSFHFHGDTEAFPISAVIVLPADAKARAITLGRYQGEEAAEQIVIPLEAVTQLTDTLFATRRMVLIAFVLLGATALALAALVFLLSFRLRDREMQTYHKIGATDTTIRLLKFAEVGVVALAGMLVAGAAVLATRALAAQILPNLLS